MVTEQTVLCLSVSVFEKQIAGNGDGGRYFYFSVLRWLAGWLLPPLLFFLSFFLFFFFFPRMSYIRPTGLDPLGPPRFIK